MPDNPILTALRKARVLDIATGPSRRGTRKRELNLVMRKDPVLSMDESRHEIMTMTNDYRMGHPTHLLLVAAPPGVGKTTVAIQAAETHAAAGHRVLYLGPRRNFFADVMRIAGHPEWWYEWKPRQLGSEGTAETCRFTPQIKEWTDRGYRALDFCSNAKICGWDYIKSGCPYHAQKAIRAPIVYGNHHHITLGHPLLEEFDLIIGDENPMDVFLRHWHFEAKYVVPNGMDLTEPFTEIVYELQQAIERGTEAEGQDLLKVLGGAQRILDACELFSLDVAVAALAPNLRRADDVEEAPFFHLPWLVNLLQREAAASVAGLVAPPRIRIQKGRLHLLLRYDVNPKATQKIIWLDGTANKRLYEEMFKRPVEVVAPKVALKGQIFQVWSRLNGKSSLLDKEGPTNKLSQLHQQVSEIVEKRGYQRPVVMTFKGAKAEFEEFESGHFSAARGTNQFSECDALFIAGAPAPPRDQIHQDARMLFFERETAFNAAWSDRNVPYAFDDHGHGWSYPVGGFWDDPDLQVMLWQTREAEIIQAAHRVRPVLQDVDIWLMTNIPIDELPPTGLLSIHELFGAPDGVDPFRWIDLLVVADEFFEAGKPMRSVDIVERLEITAPTARHYLECLVKQQYDRWQAETVLVPNKNGKVGRPAHALVPLNT